MTISPITEMPGMYPGVNVGNTKNTDASSAGGFQSIIDNVSKVDNNDVKDTYMENLPVASNRIKDTSNTNESISYEANDKTEINETNKIDDSKASDNSSESKLREDKSEASESNTESDSLSNIHKDVETDNETAVSELKDKILNEAAKKLGISVEELEKVLAQLGIGAADLCQSENVSMLVANVMGDGNVMNLVTDESAAAVVMSLNDTISSLTNETVEMTGLDMDTITDIMSEVSENETGYNMDTTDNFDGLLTNADARQNAAAVADIPSSDNKNIDAANGEMKIEQNAAETGDAVPEEKNVEDKSQNENSGREEQEHTEKQDMLSTMGDNAKVMSQVQTSPANTDFSEILKTDEVHETMYTDNREIIEQIREHIIAEVRENVTSLSMQLNPANLGSVSLNVMSKDGMVTAHLVTENENVQAALEAQAALIKESLQHQGVKVEAIEVTVSSHEFEQNLEQGNDFNNQQEEANEELRKATRKLNINGLMSESDFEDMDEEDIVTAKMMQADGNSMDYRV